MQINNAKSNVCDHLSVISLRRTPERLEGFFRRNSHTLEGWRIHIVEGVDGNQQTEIFKRSRLVSRNVLAGWSPGAIGSALSHMLCWRLCLQLGEPLVIAEDDAILATQLRMKLRLILQGSESAAQFLLLGWNLDSLLQAEFEPGLGIVSLFEPAYPNEEELTNIVNGTTERRICKLKRCFGLPAYRVTPRTAKYLLKQLNPLISEKINMGRGIPTHFSETLDGALNNQYERIGAKVIFPPLALALNDQNGSLTRKRNMQNFKE